MDGPDKPGVIAPPPFIFLAGLVAGLGVDYLWPLPLLPAPLQFWAGGAVIAASFAIVIPAIMAFRRAGTNVDVRKPATTVVSAGLYRFTRNPIYLAMVVLVCGIAIATDNLWLGVMLVPTLAVMHYGVIVREEAYLERKFGEAYLAYKAKVRRWI